MPSGKNVLYLSCILVLSSHLICVVQVNPEMVGILEEAGLKFVGKDESGQRMEVCFLINFDFWL